MDKTFTIKIISETHSKNLLTKKSCEYSIYRVKRRMIKLHKKDTII
jgi:hypothetical protein